MTGARRNPDGSRTGFGSLQQGGLNWNSLPLKLFMGGNAKFWNPADIDFTQDARDFAELTDDEQYLTLNLAASFIAGEEAVTEDLQPFLAAMAAEGRLGDELYLTQFLFEEAKHTQAFRLWLDAIGVDEDLHGYVEPSPGYRKIFYEELPKALQRLHTDHSREAQVRASVTYNHVVEGTLALTGYFAWNKMCTERGVLPGIQQIVKRIGDDERRHMAWGTFTCRRHVAADDRLWDVVGEQMNSLLEPALELVRFPLESFILEGKEIPLELTVDELVNYAFDRATRRLGAIESARGRDVAEIDLDYSPLDLEETFHEEDVETLAAVAR